MDENLAYHQKMAQMSNELEKANLKKTEKKIDKLRSDKYSELTREEKELRKQVQRLASEREESKRELDDVHQFLQEMEEADGSQTSALRRGSIARKGVDKILMDNATPHKTQRTMELPAQEQVEVMDWSPMSPDMNVIEHVWEYLGLQRSHIPHVGHVEEEPEVALDAHQVALRLLEHQLTNKGPKKARPGTKQSEPSTDAAVLTQKSVPTDIHVSKKDSPKIPVKETLFASTGRLPKIIAEQLEDKADDTKVQGNIESDTTGVEDWLKASNISKTQSEFVPSTRSSAKSKELTKASTTIDSRATTAVDSTLSQTEKEQLDMEALRTYYEILSDTHGTSAHDGEPGSSPGVASSNLSTYKRSQRRKVLALEALLKQLPSFKKKQQQRMTHMDALTCRYLRMPQSTIRELETLCRQEEGVEPGIHAHMTEDDVIAFLENLPLPGSESAAESRASSHSNTRSPSSTGNVSSGSRHAALGPKSSSPTHHRSWDQHF